jgi:hypothetical protein
LLGLRWRSVSDEHLNYFAPDTLLRLFERAALERIDIETTALDVNELKARLPKLPRRPQGSVRPHAEAPAQPTPPDTDGPGPPSWRAVGADWSSELLNGIVGALRLGDTLKGLARKPGSR